MIPVAVSVGITGAFFVELSSLWEVLLPVLELPQSLEMDCELQILQHW